MKFRTKPARLAILAALATAAAVASGVFAAPASAGTNCDPGYHCVFYSTFASAKRQYLNGASNFTRQTFDAGGTYGRGETVNDNNWSLSNSTSSNYYSLYFVHINYTGPGGVVGDNHLICVAPGASVSWDRMSSDDIRGNGVGQRDEASSLYLTRDAPGGVCLG